jgi:hypothetical protein
MSKVNIYQTRTMLAAINQVPPVHTFLLDTFFPNVETTVSENVDVDFKKGKRKMAPFVAPRIGGKVIDRQGFKTSTYKVPKIAPERLITMDDINTRTAGESLYSLKTPAQRAAELLISDLMELDEMIVRREEWMCREVLFNGKVTMKDEGLEQVVDYQFTNKEILAGDARWTEATSKPLENLKKWRLKVIKDTGKAPDIVVMESSVAEAFIRNPEVKELLDLQRLNVGSIEPSVRSEAVTFYGKINSLNLEIYSYDEWYYDEETKQDQPMVPVGHILMANRGSNKRLYGAVTQVEDTGFVTYESTRVPKSWIDKNNEVRKVRLSSRPLPVPDNVDGWYVAQVL